MTTWITVAGALGALGLFVAGQHGISAGLKGALPWVSARLPRERSGWASYLHGLAMSLMAPSNAWSTQVSLAAVQRSGCNLERGLWRLLGASLALAWTCALAVLLGTRGAGLEPIAWTLVATGSLAGALLPRWRSQFWMVLGSGVCLLGALLLEDALSAFAGTRLDAWNLSLPVRCGLMVALGGALAAGLRSASAVLLAALFAAGHGSLHVTSTIGIFIGAAFGQLVATLPTWRRDQGGTAEGRRMAIGLSTIIALGAAAALFFLVIGLPLLGDLPEPFDDPLWNSAGWITAALIAGNLVAAPLVIPGARILETRLGKLASDANHSPVLDPATRAMPHQALEALREELAALRGMTSSLARRVLGEERVSDFRVRRDIEAVGTRCNALSRFTDQLLAGEMHGANVRAFENAPGIARGYLFVCRGTEILRRPELQPSALADSALRARLLQFRWGFLHFLERGCVPEAEPFARQQELNQLEAGRRDLERRILNACWQHVLAPASALPALEAVELLQAAAHALYFSMDEAGSDAHPERDLETALHPTLASSAPRSKQDFQIGGSPKPLEQSARRQ